MGIPQRWQRTANVRANDMDRSIVCTMLDNAYASGELDTAEHDVRLKVAMAAKTQPELIDLVNDLQAPLPEFARPAAASSGPRRSNLGTLWIVGAVVVAIVVVCGAGGALVFNSLRSSDPAQPFTQTTIVTRAAAPTFERSKFVDLFNTEFTKSTGLVTDRVDCPHDLVIEAGRALECTIVHGDQSYRATVEVVSVRGSSVDYTWTMYDIPDKE